MSVNLVKIGENSYKLEYKDLKDVDKNDKNIMIVYGYCRVSDKLQKDNDSIKSQIKSIENTVNGSGGTLISIYVDDGISAKNMNRPSFQELLKICRKNCVDFNKKMEIDTVFLHRFTRSEDDFISITKDLIEWGTHLYCYDCKFNIFDSTQLFMGKFMAYNAQQTREATSKHVKIVMNTMSEEGTLLTNKKYGYKLIKNPDKGKIIEGNRIRNSYEEIPHEQEMIKLIIKLHLEGKSNITIRSIFNDDEDYYYKENKPLWPYGVISRIIYEYKLSKREIKEVIPMYKRDERLKEEIIRMLKDENLYTLSPTIIARKLDELGLFKAKITVRVATELIKKLGDAYEDIIKENKKKHIEKIIEILRKNKDMSNVMMSNLLNDRDLYTMTMKPWTAANLSYFKLKYLKEEN